MEILQIVNVIASRLAKNCYCHMQYTQDLSDVCMCNCRQHRVPKQITAEVATIVPGNGKHQVKKNMSKIKFSGKQVTAKYRLRRSSTLRKNRLRQQKKIQWEMQRNAFDESLILNLNKTEKLFRYGRNVWHMGNVWVDPNTTQAESCVRGDT